ncbi:MAG: type 1 glutamine amidotransferase [Desulfobacterales bacterium]
MKRLHYLQHVSFEGLGSIAAWAGRAGFQTSVTRFFQNDPLPALKDVDWLVIMGGPMNIYQETAYPWLGTEKKFIRQAIAAGRIVLGICLGAQLIADALGAAVKSNRHREIGWFPIYKTAAAEKLGVAAAWPDKLPVLHWHGDTFDVPEGAVHLARSAACDHQAFVFNHRVVALQFHLEATPGSLERLIFHCRGELDGRPYVQEPAAMLAESVRFMAANQAMDRLLDQLNRL